MPANHINKDSFQTEVIDSKIPVLVDFWAAWCGPCRMLAPIIEELSDELDGKISVCKLDVDEAGEISETYGVMSIPTLILFVNGEEKERIVGLRSKADLLEVLKSY